MQVQIKDKVFPLELLKSPEEIEKGMMGRESLEGAMGFKLGKGFHSFWMKDCLIPLDIVFVLNDRINKIFSDCQPCNGEDCGRYKAAAEIVYEFPAGTAKDWAVGDNVNLYLGTKYNPI